MGKETKGDEGGMQSGWGQGAELTDVHDLQAQFSAVLMTLLAFRAHHLTKVDRFRSGDRRSFRFVCSFVCGHTVVQQLQQSRDLFRHLFQLVATPRNVFACRGLQTDNSGSVESVNRYRGKEKRKG